MAKVCTGRLQRACMSATISEELIPPDRNAPKGTSAIMRRRTASPSSASSCAECLGLRRAAAIGLRAARRPEPGSQYARQAGLRARRQDQELAGQQFVHSAVDGMLGRHVAPAHKGAEALAVDLGRPARMGAQRLELGGEQEQLAEMTPEERLQPDAVAGQRQGPGRTVPDREREHADELAQSRLDPPRGARLDQNLGVGVPAKRSPRADNSARKLGMIVDFAVVGQHAAAARGGHRLMAGGDRSRIERRRCANATPATGSVQTPASSGPRWRSGVAMAAAARAQYSAL